MEFWIPERGGDDDDEYPRRGWDSNQSGSSDTLAASDPYESDLSSLNNTVLQ